MQDSAVIASYRRRIRADRQLYRDIPFRTPSTRPLGLAATVVIQKARKTIPAPGSVNPRYLKATKRARGRNGQGGRDLARSHAMRRRGCLQPHTTHPPSPKDRMFEKGVHNTVNEKDLPRAQRVWQLHNKQTQPEWSVRGDSRPPRAAHHTSNSSRNVRTSTKLQSLQNNTNVRRTTELCTESIAQGQLGHISNPRSNSTLRPQSNREIPDSQPPKPSDAGSLNPRLSSVSSKPYQSRTNCQFDPYPADLCNISKYTTSPLLPLYTTHPRI